MADQQAAAKEKEARPSASQQTAAQDKKKFDLLGTLVLGLVTINLFTIGGLGYYLQKISSRLHEVEQAAQKPHMIVSSNPEESNLGRELEAKNVAILYPIESFLVNIQSDQGSKFLQTQIELELADNGLEEEISRKKAAIRDAIIVHLSSRSYKELREQDGLKKLRKDLIGAINHLLTTGKIKDLYFTQFHFN